MRGVGGWGVGGVYVSVQSQTDEGGECVSSKSWDVLLFIACPETH